MENIEERLQKFLIYDSEIRNIELHLYKCHKKYHVIENGKYWKTFQKMRIQGPRLRKAKIYENVEKRTDNIGPAFRKWRSWNNFFRKLRIMSQKRENINTRSLKGKNKGPCPQKLRIWNHASEISQNRTSRSQKVENTGLPFQKMRIQDPILAAYICRGPLRNFLTESMLCYLK